MIISTKLKRLSGHFYNVTEKTGPRSVFTGETGWWVFVPDPDTGFGLGRCR